MKNGVPWDVAWSLDDAERGGFAIHFSQFEGAEFDTNTMQFREPRT